MTTTPMTIGAGPRMAHVAVHSIAPSLTNPRKHFDPAKLQELADSIAASGVHQPILLRPLPAARLEDTLREARAQKRPAPEYELVAGERRWRACQLAGVAEIPAMIRPMTDAQALEAQVIENLQREDVTELEEAEGYQILMETVGINADEVGQRIGKSRSYVYGRLKILNLCEAGRQALREGKLDFSCGLYIARIPNEQLQLKALEWATDPDYYGERPSARAVQQHVRRNFMLQLAAAKFDTADADLCPAAGACTSCPHRTGANPDLFADVNSADVCTNPPCYHAKEEAHALQLRERAQAMGAEVITGREAKTLIPTPYSGSIDGFVRLDVASDSPIQGKTLRKVVGDVLEQSGIKPTLIENPHDKNELIAVVRQEQAAELLKMAGKAEAEAKLREEAQADAEAKARQAEADAKRAYEQQWRRDVAAAVVTAMDEGNITAAGDILAECAVAQHVLRMLNKEEAAQLAAMLKLGKVAPHDALQDHAKEHNSPVILAAAAMVMRDASYTPWLWEHDPSEPRNQFLLDMAAACKVDVEAIKAKTQAALRAEVEAKKAAASPDKSEAPKANTPLNPASHTKKGAGKGKAKNTKGPAALAGEGGVKLSKEAAAASIAAALQAADGEPNPGAEAPGNDAEPVAASAAQALPPSATAGADACAQARAATPDAAGTGDNADDGQSSANAQTGATDGKAQGAWTAAELVGKAVRINENATQKKQKPWIDYEGRVTAQCGPEAVIVSIPRAKGCAPIVLSFHVLELDVIPEQEAA
ncbi:ParB/RepB/Spo0J family partition protein [Comamonas kerstersii]|uniref:ParB/RepB/Spo0J family partition protein n=1 Tax=Comamonas kerstersii TaxID=225992 RepID=UPI00266B4B04|nr:ParB/RepB/Spo0J family partition protein [Comamonas kerstersii]